MSKSEPRVINVVKESNIHVFLINIDILLVTFALPRARVRMQ